VGQPGGRPASGYPSAVIEPALTEKFRPSPSAVPEVRRFLRTALSALDGSDHEQELADSLLMAGNELATNAVLHARTEFTVRVRDDGTMVRIEVSDRNTRVPQPCLAPADATSGRGLAIVDGSGLAWGVERHTGGKTVWVQGFR
jgi:anti-sigma regulatory factor (Ser/Thr protein kinase)